MADFGSVGNNHPNISEYSPFRLENQSRVVMMSVKAEAENSPPVRWNRFGWVMAVTSRASI